MVEPTDGGTVVHSADIVVPVTSPALRNGAVATRNGVVLAIGPRETILSTHRDADEVHWDGVLMPGLVNAHAHLQYHGFAELGTNRHVGFEAWSVAFDERYGVAHETENWAAAALAGAHDAIASGTTTIADICTDISAINAVPESGLSGITFIETLGHTAMAWWTTKRDEFLARLDACRSTTAPNFRIGVSPHAPYSLDTDVLRDLAEESRACGLRIHTHLAESAFEDEYYRTGTGPLADFVAGFGRRFQILTDGGTRKGAAEFARDLGLLGPDSHVAHGIYLDKRGRAILRETATAVALCPRSNATIGLDPAPIAAYLREGNHICVGTDSLSSAPSIDVLEDVRTLSDLAIEQGYDSPDLAPRLVCAATVDGARALGMAEGDGRVGAIEKGARADFAVLGIDANLDTVEHFIVARGAGSCTSTIIAGERVPAQRPTTQSSAVWQAN